MRNWTIREQHDCHWHFVINQHISWQGVSSILIFPTALYYVNIADVVYMHVSMVIKQKFITRVCITRCLHKNLYMRCPYLACHRRHRTPKRRWLLSYPLQKIQLPSLAAFLAATKQLNKWYFPSVCLSVRLSVCLSHLFHHVPIIVSSWNFQELLPWSRVMSMQKVKVRGQRSRSQRSTPNLAVSGL